MRARECQNIEYKTSWHDKYLEWICGFANAQGAVMYFGVNDEHEVVGLENVDRLMEDIPNKLRRETEKCCVTPFRQETSTLLHLCGV